MTDVVIAGYGPAWISHFFIEKNKPASWKHPVWSFRGDMVMWWKTLTRTMDAEVERVLAEVFGGLVLRLDDDRLVPCRVLEDTFLRCQFQFNDRLLARGKKGVKTETTTDA